MLLGHKTTTNKQNRVWSSHYCVLIVRSVNRCFPLGMEDQILRDDNMFFREIKPLWQNNSKSSISITSKLIGYSELVVGAISDGSMWYQSHIYAMIIISPHFTYQGSNPWVRIPWSIKTCDGHSTHLALWWHRLTLVLLLCIVLSNVFH